MARAVVDETGFDPRSKGARDGRLNRAAVAIVVAMGFSVVGLAVVAGASSAPAEVVGGDFSAHYGAGRMVLDGQWDSLYDLEAQLEAQSDLYRRPGIGVYFPYPPQVAAAYAPFALLPYSVAWALHTLLMGAALWASILIARPMIPWMRGREAVALAAALTFWPMFRAVTGGSNTAVTVLIVVATWRLVRDQRDLVAGVALSLLLFKPHFGVPLIGLFLLGRYWRVLAGAALGAGVFVVTGALALGVGWIPDWVNTVRAFGPIDAEMNGHSAIAFVGFTENAFGPGSPLVAVGWVAAIAAIVALCGLWIRMPRSQLGLAVALTVPGLLAISPHTMSHDGGAALITIAFAVQMSLCARRPWGWMIGVLWTVALSQALILRLGFSPGLGGLLLLVAWTLYLAWMVDWAPEPFVQDRVAHES